MNRIAKALAPFSGAAAAVIFSAAVFAAAPARAQCADQVKADFARAVYLGSAAQVHNEALQMLRSGGLVEAWLFQNDGRFALKTLAKPQRTA
jgi:hypothetical protein